jgi:hypothetical protein
MTDIPVSPENHGQQPNSATSGSLYTLICRGLETAFSNSDSGFRMVFVTLACIAAIVSVKGDPFAAATIAIVGLVTIICLAWRFGPPNVSRTVWRRG